jgi:hypothetical protein
MIPYIITGVICLAIGFAVAWSLAFDIGWDTGRVNALEEDRSARAIAHAKGVAEGRAKALGEVYFARSEAATRAAQTRAENRKLGAALRAMFAEDLPRIGETPLLIETLAIETPDTATTTNAEAA